MEHNGIHILCLTLTIMRVSCSSLFMYPCGMIKQPSPSWILGMKGKYLLAMYFWLSDLLSKNYVSLWLVPCVNLTYQVQELWVWAWRLFHSNFIVIMWQIIINNLSKYYHLKASIIITLLKLQSNPKKKKKKKIPFVFRRRLLRQEEIWFFIFQLIYWIYMGLLETEFKYEDM